MTDEARAAWIALAHAAEPGDVGVGRLVARIGPIRALELLVAGRSGLRHGEALRSRLDASEHETAEARAARVGARIVTRTGLEWPTQVEDLGWAAPHALWVVGAGHLRLLALRSIAVVGARACTAYGEEVARSWAAELSREWSILSGGAFGIDAAAHRGALLAGGTTICVLAGGVDVPYPRAHEALLARIGDEGLVVSESPPGEGVRRQRFLSRNRVIAALGRATLVIEAAERSGTIVTARVAGDLYRPVLAVPGPVGSPASAGCHRMIRDGEASLVSGVDDVRSVLDLSHASVADRSAADPRDALGATERRVLDALPGRGSLDANRLAAAACLATADLWSALGRLEASGWIEAVADGWRLSSRAGRPRA